MKERVHAVVGLPLEHIVVLFKGTFLEDGDSLHGAGWQPTTEGQGGGPAVNCLAAEGETLEKMRLAAQRARATRRQQQR